jgi:hypothetical protein
MLNAIVGLVMIHGIHMRNGITHNLHAVQLTPEPTCKERPVVLAIQLRRYSSDTLESILCPFSYLTENFKAISFIMH